MDLLNNKKGLRYWKRSKKVIPGGNCILSKRPERYAPDLWPTYYKKAKGCYIWDLEGKKYVDMAQMGIGSAILGYSNKEVDESVRKAISQGINTTLNSFEEVHLAETLIKLNTFAGGVKFARTGGEAMSIAIRIARGYSKKKIIAFSGYHGWYDWYLAANLRNKKNLNTHLLPGLSPLGVPKELSGSIVPFKYNDENDFKKVLRKNRNIGIVVIEGARYDYPKNNFVKSILEEVKKRKLLLIIDEITSGFRVSNSGSYTKTGLKPDIVVYGKGLGNGYAISAVVGKKNIMNTAQDTFISSTNWSERIGFVAALKTIKIICRDKTWKHINYIGDIIGEGWETLAKKHNLKITISNFKPLISMKFNYGKFNQLLITYFTQEMLRRGYLASNSVYVSSAHTQRIVKKYLKNVDEVFKKMSQNIIKKSINKSLKTRVRQEGFKRLN